MPGSKDERSAAPPRRRKCRSAHSHTHADRGRDLAGGKLSSVRAGALTSLCRSPPLAAAACLCVLGLGLLGRVGGGCKADIRPGNSCPLPLFGTRPLRVRQLRLRGGWGPARDPRVWGRGTLTGDGNSPTRAGEEGFAPRSFAHRITREDLQVKGLGFGV